MIAEVAAPAEARIDRQGFLDFVCFEHRTPVIAVEIDRAHKQWSQQKLEAVAARGVTALWLRWGSRTLPTDLARWRGSHPDAPAPSPGRQKRVVQQPGLAGSH